MVDPIGRNIGPYEILEQIGAGGMATVYKAYQPAMGRHVAIKLLPQRLAHDPNFRARFQREARTISSLEHRYILPVYDFGEDQGVSYLVMRYADGGTLADMIAQRSLSVTRLLEIASQVAEALAYAHDQGVIHRDIKPANVLIGRDGSALLSDFGIAKVYAETLQLTDEGMLIGTPAYMAPEQVQGQRVDGRTDIYALGVVLYQALTGEYPFAADTPLALALMHLHNQPRPPRQLNPAIPEALERVVLRALAKNPDDRFQEAGELAEALRHAQSSLRDQFDGVSSPTARPPQPADPAPPSAPDIKTSLSHRLLWLRRARAGMLAIAILAAILFFLRLPPPPEGPSPPAAAPHDLGTLEQPSAVLGRGGGASTYMNGQVLWTFNSTIASVEEPIRSATAAFGDRDHPLGLTETLDARGAPLPFLPLTDDERAHNAANEQDAYHLLVGSIVADTDRALVFYKKMRGPDIFNLKNVGSGIAYFTAGGTSAERDPGLLFPDPEPSFQAAALVDGPDVYVYACESDQPLQTGCFVAQAPLASAEQRAAYQFWDGKQWVSSISQAQPILHDPVSFSISWNACLNRFLAVYSPIFSNDIMMRTAPRPVGPWSAPVLMFHGMTPETGYNNDAREHPELASNGGRTVIVSYVRPQRDLREEIRLVQVTFDRCDNSTQ